MATTSYFVPVLELLPYWPHDLVTPSDIPLLGAISQFVGVSELDVIEYDGHLTLTGTLAVWDEVELDLPFADGLSLVLGQTGGDVTELPFELRLGQAADVGAADSVLEGAFTLFLKGFLPPYELYLPELDVKLRVSQRHLKPMVPKNPLAPEDGFEDGPPNAHTEFVVRGALAINTDTGVRLEGLDRVDLDYAQIGSTGVVIRAEDVLLRLSDAQPLPGIDPEAVDLPEDWTGFYCSELSAYNLQQIWELLPASLELTNWYFGKGGVTGKAVALFDLTPDMTDQSFALRSLQFAIEQNSLVQALIQIAVKLGFWDDKIIYLDVGVTNDPELDFPQSLGFLGSVSDEQPSGGDAPTANELLVLRLSAGTTVLAKLGITKLGVRSLPDVARAEDQEKPAETRFFDIIVDGQVSVLPATGVGEAAFGAGVRDLALQVAPDFRLLMPNGLWLDVSEEIIAKISAFPLSISRIGFGVDDEEKWIGLDARLAFGSTNGFGAAVKGLRIYFGGPAGLHLAFNGIEIKVVSLPAFSLAGFLSMTTAADPGGMADPTDKTFQGGVEILIGGIGLKVDGFILFGTKDGQRFWYFALDGTFEPGWMIGSTSVALLGAAIMLGHNVTPNRLLTGDHGDQFNWYENWYKPAPGPFSVIHSGKWVPAPDTDDSYWAFGIGASLGNFTGGKFWSLKSLVAIISPGPVIIIEGKLQLFSNPEKHAGPPTSDLIRGLVVMDFDESVFLLTIQANYKMPESGILWDLHAEGEIFTRGWPPDDWYVAIGWYEPISRRVRATALRLFNWDFYLIVSGRDLSIGDRTFPGVAVAAGFRAGFDKRWKFGPLRVVVAAWFSLDVAVSLDPLYVLGQVQMHGEIAVKVWGFGFELMLDARLALECPVNEDDLYFAGEITVKIGLPWPLSDIKKDIPITFGDASALPPPVDPLIDSASVTPGYPSSGEPIFRRSEALTAAALPLDGRVVISFRRGMRSSWSGAPTPGSIARPDQVGDVFYRYTVTDVRVTVTRGDGSTGPLTERLFGQWSVAVGDDSGPRTDSLVLWGISPFPQAGSLGWPSRTVRRSWVDLMMRFHEDYPCGDDPPKERCVDFDLVALGVYDPELRYRPDERYRAVVFKPFPGESALDTLRLQWAEIVQTPIQVVLSGQADPDRRRCLRFARTTLIGQRDDDVVRIVRQSRTLWGTAVELPASRRAAGLVDYSTKHFQLRVQAFDLGNKVLDRVFTGHGFEITVAAPVSFDRVELLLTPIGTDLAEVEGPAPCLREFCYTSLGMIEEHEEINVIRDHWVHIFDAITVTEGDDPDLPIGEGLIHEPGTTYRIDVDVRTDVAESLSGPWTAQGTATEQLSVPIGEAPNDLSPYLDAVTPGDGERPVYADYDLRVMYNRSYVEAMYHKTGHPLRAVLLDALGRPVEPTAVPSNAAQPSLTEELEVFLSHVADAGCVSVDISTIPGNDETTYLTRLAVLTPYEVHIRGGGHADPLHRWTFTTSRYRNFAEHVEELRSEPWEERLPDTIDWAALTARLATASGTTDRDQEFDLFLAAWQQDLGLGLGTLPDRPEVRLFWESPETTPAVRGLAIISPEPLMTERTELLLRRRETDGTWTELSYRRLRSRDGTRALVIPTDAADTPIALAASDYRLEFVFRTSRPGLVGISRGGVFSDETAVWPFRIFDEPQRLVDSEA